MNNELVTNTRKIKTTETERLQTDTGGSVSDLIADATRRAEEFNHTVQKTSGSKRGATGAAEGDTESGVDISPSFSGTTEKREREAEEL